MSQNKHEIVLWEIVIPYAFNAFLCMRGIYRSPRLFRRQNGIVVFSKVTLGYEKKIVIDRYFGTMNSIIERLRSTHKILLHSVGRNYVKGKQDL